MLFRQAPLQRATRPLHLADLPHPGLHEHRQQDDPPTGRDPLGDAHRLTVQMEPKLPELAVELPGVPVTNLWLRLNGTPRHSINAIVKSPTSEGAPSSHRVIRSELAQDVRDRVGVRRVIGS